MAIYYNSSALIGYAIIPIKSNIQTVELRPSCDHEKPDNVNFCPTCGRAVKDVETTRWTEAWNDFLENCFYVGRWPAGYVSEHDFESNPMSIWFGYGVITDHSKSSMLPLKPYDEIKSEIAKIMQPWIDKGLFTLDDEKFGLWSTCIGH